MLVAASLFIRLVIILSRNLHQPGEPCLQLGGLTGHTSRVVEGSWAPGRALARVWCIAELIHLALIVQDLTE